MGCLKIPYDQEGGLEKSTVHFFGPLAQKRGQQIFCIDYYPFGLTFNSSERSGYTSNKFLYNSKEWQDDLDLDWYDYGARMYDAAVGRFGMIDPDAQMYTNLSPYVYAGNNPLRFIDKNGLGPEDRVTAAKNFTGTAYKQETTYSLRTGGSDEALKYMDCSEFVCRVMAADNITDGVKHMAGKDLLSYLQNDEKFEFSQTAKIGDIAAWDGHFGIVTEVGDDGKIKLTHARGVGKLAKENAWAIKPEQYRSNFIGYFRPISESDNSGGAEDNNTYFGRELNEVVIRSTNTNTLQPISPVGNSNGGQGQQLSYDHYLKQMHKNRKPSQKFMDVLIEHNFETQKHNLDNRWY